MVPKPGVTTQEGKPPSNAAQAERVHETPKVASVSASVSSQDSGKNLAGSSRESGVSDSDSVGDVEVVDVGESATASPAATPSASAPSASKTTDGDRTHHATPAKVSYGA